MFSRGMMASCFCSFLKMVNRLQSKVLNWTVCIPKNIPLLLIQRTHNINKNPLTTISVFIHGREQSITIFTHSCQTEKDRQYTTKRDVSIRQRKTMILKTKGVLFVRTPGVIDCTE